MPDVLQIAEVILRSARSFSVVTTPGHKLHFWNGRAVILNDGDLDYVLGMPDAVLELEARYVEHVAQRIALRNTMHPAVADVHWPATAVIDDLILEDTPPTIAVEEAPAPVEDVSSGWPVEPVLDDIVTVASDFGRRGRPRKE